MDARADVLVDGAEFFVHRRDALYSIYNTLFHTSFIHFFVSILDFKQVFHFLDPLVL